MLSHLKSKEARNVSEAKYIWQKTMTRTLVCERAWKKKTLKTYTLYIRDSGRLNKTGIMELFILFWENPQICTRGLPQYPPQWPRRRPWWRRGQSRWRTHFVCSRKDSPCSQNQPRIMLTDFAHHLLLLLAILFEVVNRDWKLIHHQNYVKVYCAWLDYALHNLINYILQWQI